MSALRPALARAQAATGDPAAVAALRASLRGAASATLSKTGRRGQ